MAWGKAKVRLSVRNASKYSVDLRVQIVKGARIEFSNHGSLQPDAEKAIEFKMKKSASYQVLATLPGSATIYRSGLQTVSEDHSTSIQVIGQTRELDDTQSLDQMSRSFKVLGDDIGAAPIGVEDAIRTRFGAIVVAVPGAAGRPSRIIHVVEPNVLGVRVATLEDINYPRTNETQSVTISGSAGARASASLGPVAKFGIAWDSSKIYQLKWVLRGFGQVNKQEDPQKSYVSQFNSLPADRKAVVRKLLETPEAKLYYINRMYVIERAEVFVKEGEKQSANAELSATGVLSASGVYTFDRSVEVNNGYGPAVLNYWGDEFVWIDTTRESVNAIGIDALQTIRVAGLMKDRIELLVPTGLGAMFHA